MKVSHNQKVFIMQGIQSELCLIVHTSTIVIGFYYFNNEFSTFSIHVLNSSWSSNVLSNTVLEYRAYFIIFSFLQDCSSVIFHLYFTLP